MRKNKDLFSIFPADAGVNLYYLISYQLSPDIPRGCGGEPKDRSQYAVMEAYSPRMRG